MKYTYQLYKAVLMKKIEIIELRFLKDQMICEAKYELASKLRDRERILQSEMQEYQNLIKKLKIETEIKSVNISKLELIDNIDSEFMFRGFCDETILKIQGKLDELKALQFKNETIDKEISFLTSILKFKR